MSNLISVIIVIAIFAVVAKKKGSAFKSLSQGKGSENPARKYTNYRPHKDLVSVSRDMGDKNTSVLKDDKNNDWLARQLRDEHRAFKATSEMFDLKIEHASHCDARLLEQFHRRNCTAEAIDLADGSAAKRPS